MERGTKEGLPEGSLQRRIIRALGSIPLDRYLPLTEVADLAKGELTATCAALHELERSGLVGNNRDEGERDEDGTSFRLSVKGWGFVRELDSDLGQA